MPDLFVYEKDLVDPTRGPDHIPPLFLQPNDRLDVLLNNAGVMAGPAGLSAPTALEAHLATNHLGHAVPVRALPPSPVLRRTAALPGPRRPRRRPYLRRVQGRLANMLFTRELARLHPSIASVAVHPGVVDTEGVLAGFD
ncbi:hypothetical protein LY76DRAFT_601597 [Colletotrichum caudatum]|nr:hypothetical protein LY76DRAFT_601597 [Colletotrichum caudatum]